MPTAMRQDEVRRARSSTGPPLGEPTRRRPETRNSRHAEARNALPDDGSLPAIRGAIRRLTRFTRCTLSPRRGHVIGHQCDGDRTAGTSETLRGAFEEGQFVGEPEQDARQPECLTRAQPDPLRRRLAVRRPGLEDHAGGTASSRGPSTVNSGLRQSCFACGLLHRIDTPPGRPRRLARGG